jgi:hypothetical protein
LSGWPERPVIRFNSLEMAVRGAFKLQQGLCSKWVESISELEKGLVGCLEENSYLFGLLAMHHLLLEEIKQFVVPSMLVMVDEIEHVWLVPLSAGNSAAEMLWNYVLVRKGYDDQFYEPRDLVK